MVLVTDQYHRASQDVLERRGNPSRNIPDFLEKKFPAEHVKPMAENKWNGFSEIALVLEIVACLRTTRRIGSHSWNSKHTKYTNV